MQINAGSIDMRLFLMQKMLLQLDKSADKFRTLLSNKASHSTDIANEETVSLTITSKIDLSQINNSNINIAWNDVYATCLRAQNFLFGHLKEIDKSNAKKAKLLKGILNKVTSKLVAFRKRKT